ncbi:hypothetical protein M407DRAFT_24206 [Tulasnella calospora MUT 4182]|uniref:F-box domain-containing protein n=1 Tax=Tulasnella calospora MUT 4182 TaxID=1051891 RepID=A0A0C3Q956_9AGAM|nr:hypothetical protein M407DRAFT_24206 [Tulasnella calospora MUT 4182]
MELRAFSDKVSGNSVMETGYSTYNPALNGDASLRAMDGHNGPVASISQLPTELLIIIFQFALPPVDLALMRIEDQIVSYTRMLYTIRRIAKPWQEIVDGTPTFWKFVTSTLPYRINEATISRSGSGPLTVVCAFRVFGKRDPQEFVDSLAHTFPRWSAYSGPLVSGYFDMPAPHLQTLVLWKGGPCIAVAELLGGSATNLRHVDLSEISFRWKTGLFAELKVLKLTGPFSRNFKLTTTHLLDALRASPGLEHLQLYRLSPSLGHPPSSPVVTHPHLRYINLDWLDAGFAGAILHRMRAPSCTEFYMKILPADPKQENTLKFLNESLGLCREVTHAIHSRNGSSEIYLDGNAFKWTSEGPVQDVEHLSTFSITIFCEPPTPCISWVEHILQDDSGLSIRFNYYSNLDEEVLESIKPMRCATRVVIGDAWSVDKCLPVLKLIGEPLSTDLALPSLPCLQELLLIGAGWTAHNLLDMVCSRFNSLLWESTKRTPLTISMSRRTFASNGVPRPISDLTTLARIREIDKVECVRFVGWEELDGTLAITWDDKTSAPAWV